MLSYRNKAEARRLAYECRKATEGPMLAGLRLSTASGDVQGYILTKLNPLGFLNSTRPASALPRPNVRYWQVSTVFECPPFGHCWGQSGHRDRAKMEQMTHS
jgi:hypothetical protein